MRHRCTPERISPTNTTNTTNNTTTNNSTTPVLAPCLSPCPCPSHALQTHTGAHLSKTPPTPLQPSWRHACHHAHAPAMRRGHTPECTSPKNTTISDTTHITITHLVTAHPSPTHTKSISFSHNTSCHHLPRVSLLSSIPRVPGVSLVSSLPRVARGARVGGFFAP